ncbi:MAG: DNA repair exonuclease [Thermodesulfobacteriota bacterium]
MPRVTFIHTADIHLDTPFKGLSEIDADLADRLRQSTFQAFRRVVDLCLREPADFLLIAGDTFDGETRSLSAQLGFAEELGRLAEAGIPVYLTFGNHDPADDWLREIPLPGNVHCFSPARPETVTFSKDGRPLADIHGLSFDGGKSADNPVLLFRKTEDPAPFSIGLLHATVGPAGPHAPYSPFAVDDVMDKGFDYWALGHVHKQRIVRQADPAIVYPGNPQGRDFGEPGLKGCCRVVLETGRQPVISVIPTCAIRFETVSVDLSDIEALTEVPDKIEEAIGDSNPATEADCLTRVVLRGRTPLHQHLSKEEDLSDLARRMNELRAGTRFYHIDRIESETLPDIDLAAVARGNDFPAEVFRTIRGYDDNPAESSRLIQSLAGEFATPGIRKEISLPDEEACRRIMALAQRQLIDLFFP